MNQLSITRNKNSRGVSGIHYEFSFCRLTIIYLLTMISLSITRNHCLFREFNMNLLSSSLHFLWIHFLFRASTMIPFLFRELTINLANFLGIHYLFREFTWNSLLFLANSIWIQFLFHEFLFHEFLFSLSVSRLHYEFTICFAYSLFLSNWMHSFYPLYPD